MQSLRYLGAGVADLITVPVPVPGENEALVRILASAICGSERHQPSTGHDGNAGHEAADFVEESPNWSHVESGELVGLSAVVGCGSCRHCVIGQEMLCEESPTCLDGWQRPVRVCTRGGTAQGASGSRPRVGRTPHGRRSRRPRTRLPPRAQPPGRTCDHHQPGPGGTSSRACSGVRRRTRDRGRTLSLPSQACCVHRGQACIRARRQHPQCPARDRVLRIPQCHRRMLRTCGERWHCLAVRRMPLPRESPALADVSAPRNHLHRHLALRAEHYAFRPCHIEIAFHPGMGPGGMLFRNSRRDPWSSMSTRSASGLEAFVWPDLIESVLPETLMRKGHFPA